MEINNPNPPINPLEGTIEPVSKTVNRKRILFPIILGALLLLIVVGGAYYLGTQNSRNNKSTNINTSITISPQNNTAIKPIETQIATLPTTQTTQATSLDVLLYPNAQWKETPIASADSDLQKVFVYKSSQSSDLNSRKNYFFSGKYYTATIQKPDKNNISRSVEDYYYLKLISQQGWLGPFGHDKNIIYNDFVIDTINSNGVCGLSLGMQGYHNGYIRLVSYSYQFRPCIGLDGKILNPASPQYPNTNSSDYSLFISDPVPIQTVINLAK